MFELLIWAALATGPATQPPQPPDHPIVAWLYKATEPDVVVALFLPILGAILLWVRRSTQNEARLGREEFKDTLLSELSEVIAKEIRGLQSQIDLKVEKISVQIEYISRQSEENDENIKCLSDNLDKLDNQTQELKAAVYANYRYDSEFLARIDSELSAVLSSYLKCPVEIKLFRTRAD